MRYRSCVPAGLERQDFEGAGNLALCKAARDFDPARGVLFITYAITRIRGAMLELVRTWRFESRTAYQRANRAGVDLPAMISLQDPLPSGDGSLVLDLLPDDAPTPFETAFVGLRAQALSAAVDRLPERERTCIRLYFGENLTYKQIAAALTVSESRAYQLVEQALKRLRRDGELSALAA